jgi:hypothetical protein
LDGELRAFFESRFGRDLGDVRLHTGNDAAVLSDILRARAFTLGRDIFFAKGEYRPNRPEGLHLLAHELVHVVQQDSDRSPVGTCSVGLASDPLEAEADHVAAQILSRAPLSPISKDHARAIRRVVEVDASSVKITFNTSTAVPDVYVYPFTFPSQDPVVNTNLTNGFNGGSTPQNTTATDAWTATAEVNVNLDPATDTSKLPNIIFGFIQFEKINQVNLYYAGRVKREGGIIIQAGVPPALPRKFGTDWNQSPTHILPWVRWFPGDQAYKPARKVAEVTMGDHPQMRAKAVLDNDKTRYPNFLFKFIDDRQFLTVFAVKFPRDVYQFLAYFEWSVVWSYEFGWKHGLPIKIKGPTTSFKCPTGTVTTGKLPIPPLSVSQVLNPTTIPVLGTPELTQAIQASVANKVPPNRSDELERFGVMPGSFNP